MTSLGSGLVEKSLAEILKIKVEEDEQIQDMFNFMWEQDQASSRTLQTINTIVLSINQILSDPSTGARAGTEEERTDPPEVASPCTEIREIPGLDKVLDGLGGRFREEFISKDKEMDPYGDKNHQVTGTYIFVS